MLFRSAGMSTPLLLKSAEAYENAAKILKKNSDVRYNLALDYHLLGNYRDAGKNYCRAIKLSPMNYEAHYNMAILLRRMKYYRASLEELEKAALLVSTANSTVRLALIEIGLGPCETDPKSTFSMSSSTVTCTFFSVTTSSFFSSLFSSSELS